MIAAYWHKQGLDIYRVTGGKATKFVSGDLERLKPVRSWGKKILIVGRDLLFHVRKRYPPASDRDINKAARVEANDFFPLNDPACFIRIGQRTSSYVLADMWAWDCSVYGKLEQVFPFTHVVPEDVALVADGPEISIADSDGVAHMVAYAKEGFMGAATFRGEVTAQRVEIFLKGLGSRGSEVQKIIFSGDEKAAENLKDLPLQVVFRQPKEFPACIGTIGRVNLKSCRVRSALPVSVDAELAARVVLYGVIAYGFFLFMSARNYDFSVKEISARTNRLTKEARALGSAGPGEDYTDVASALNEKLKGTWSPLVIMDELARYLPEKSFVTRVVLNENNLEFSCSSKEPLAVVKALGKTERFRQVRLKGAPMKDLTKGMYNFVLTVEMK